MPWTWQQVLTAIGHALAAIWRVLWQVFAVVVTALWRHVALPLLEGFGHGLGTLARTLGPWIAGGIGLLALFYFAPETADALLTFTIFLGVVYVGYRFLRRGVRR
jgi:hypothetical protein